MLLSAKRKNKQISKNHIIPLNNYPIFYYYIIKMHADQDPIELL